MPSLDERTELCFVVFELFVDNVVNDSKYLDQRSLSAYSPVLCEVLWILKVVTDHCIISVSDTAWSFLDDQVA